MKTERELFEAWKKQQLDGWTDWDVWLAAKASAIPDGFVLVQKEPKYEKLRKIALSGAYMTGASEIELYGAYKAVIEAGELK